jgi:hypothetical protein
LIKHTGHKLKELLFLKGFTDRTRFTIYTTFFSIILGYYWYSLPSLGEQNNYYYSIPLATLLSAPFGWKLMMKNADAYSLGTIIAQSLILTVVVIQLTFLILAFERRITGGHINPNGTSESLVTTFLTIPFFQMLISLFYYGYVGALTFFAIAWFVAKTTQHETSQ